jgi:predicted DNA repair protein MutK
MSGGLLALLDDVVALAKLAAVTLDDAAGQAAAVTTKSAGVLIDDAAVTPRYVVGLAAERELPIVGRIAIGSLKNKLIFLLPIALLLATFAPWMVTPLLMLGGLYLCFEGYEKVHELIVPHAAENSANRKASRFTDAKALEDAKVNGAIRTDMVLSAEIMALALANVIEPNLYVKALVLAGVAVLVTVGVYGAVALIVKADDFGLYLAQKNNAVARTVGCWIVRGMPPFLKVLALIGTFAMLWVGGGILVHGLGEYGVSWPEHMAHAVGKMVPGAMGFGGLLSWLAQASVSAVFGLGAGGLTALLMLPVAALVRWAQPDKA